MGGIVTGIYLASSCFMHCLMLPTSKMCPSKFQDIYKNKV